MLHFDQHEDEGVLVVGMRGEAGVAEAQTLSELMIRLAAARPQRLVFDLLQVTFISSLALGELASLAAALRPFDCRLALAGATPLIRGAMRRVRLDRSYEMFDSLQTAMADLSGRTDLGPDRGVPIQTPSTASH